MFVIALLTISFVLLFVFVWLPREKLLVEAKVTEATIGTQLEQAREKNAELLQQVIESRAAVDLARQDNSEYREKISHLQTTIDEQKKQAEEKLTLLNEAKARLNTEFKNLANEIFASKQKVFKEESKEQLSNLLDPLSNRIKDFEKRVEETYNKESKERFSLVKEVKSLQDLNARISQDAINLTNALKGESKTQGNWGEVVLERLLEKSGLQKGREYEIQVSLKTDQGKRFQPDVIVRLPEGKDVIIDSKVSLVAYERYCSLADESEKSQALKSHVQSLRTHLRDLGQKDYQNLESVRTLDFVLLFIPIEAAFTVAVQEDTEIFMDAFDRNIVIVSPSTLLATLRTIQNIWRFEHQNRNAKEIADKAGALYDKFVNFVHDLEEIGQKLGSAQKTYDKAHNKLTSGRGNLVSRAETMKELGARVSKSIPDHLADESAGPGKKDISNPERKGENVKSLTDQS